MKKLLSILASVGMVATASSAVVACSSVDTNSNYNVYDGTVTATMVEGLKSTKSDGSDLIPSDAEAAAGGKDVTSLFELKEGYKDAGTDLKVLFSKPNAKVTKDKVADGKTQTYTVKGTITVTFKPTEDIDTYGNSDQQTFFTYTLKGKDINSDISEPIQFQMAKTTLSFKKMADDNKTIIFDQDMIQQSVATADNGSIKKGDKTPIDITDKAKMTDLKIESVDKDGNAKDTGVTITKAVVQDYKDGKKTLSDELVVNLSKALDKGNYQIVVDETNPIIMDGTITFSVK